jgi:hypothetical protein
MKEPRISFNKFKRLVLAYIIESHDLFLKPFIDIFREVDGDLDGVINEVKNFCDRINLSERIQRAYVQN